MDEQYIVAASPGAGIIGILTEREIRRRLAVGSLQPTDVCLPAAATGDLGWQWRALSVAFGAAPPGDTPAPAGVEARLAALESRLAGFRPPLVPTPVWGVVGSMLLTFGQVAAAVVCVVAALLVLPLVRQVPELQFGSELLPIFLQAVGRALASVCAAALFVVFTRVKQLPPG